MAAPPSPSMNRKPPRMIPAQPNSSVRRRERDVVGSGGARMARITLSDEMRAGGPHCHRADDETDEGTGRQAGGLDGEVGHDDERLAHGVHLEGEVEHGLGGMAVEVAGRLVGPHDRRLGHQRPGDRDPLLLATRKLGRPVRGPVAEPDPFEHGEGAVTGGAGPHAGHQQRELDVLGGGEHGDQVEALEDEAHALGPVLGPTAVGHAVDVFAVDQHGAAVDVVHPVGAGAIGLVDVVGGQDRGVRGREGRGRGVQGHERGSVARGGWDRLAATMVRIGRLRRYAE